MTNRQNARRHVFMIRASSFGFPSSLGISEFVILSSLGILSFVIRTPGFQHLVRPSVSADEEPQLAGGTVIPPLGLLSGDVRPVVEILRPLPLGRRAIRPLAGRAAVVILPHGPASAVGTVDLKGHFGFLNSEFGFRTGRRILMLSGCSGATLNNPQLQIQND